MKAKCATLLAGIVILIGILLMDYQPVTAAPPTGEIKTVGSMFGYEIPVPHLEGGHALDWMELLYDSVVGSTPEGKFSSDQGLAERWEMSPNGLTWTFYIRRGVKFHHGEELTAKDVKFSIEQLMLPETTLPESGLFREAIRSVEIKDPYTVAIQCKRPAIFLPNFLSNIEGTAGMVIPKEYYEKVGKDGFAKHPIGSGPYKFNSQRVGSFIKLEAIDKHWRDGVPRVKYMTYLIIPEESTRLAMLRTGEADIARISREAVSEVEKAGLNIVTKENSAVIVFHPNMQWTSPVFSDIRFRKALNLAIDKEAIIKHLLAGLAKPIATYPGSNIFAVGGDPTLQPYPYDPQEARRLLKEGGWEGYEFTLISYPRAGCPEFTGIVEAMAGYWQKVGLNPKIRMSEYSVWRQAWSERKTQNSIHGYDSGTDPDVVSLLEKFQEKWYFGHKSKRSTVNIPEFEERFQRMEKSMSATEISRLMAEIYRYAYDNYLMIPICEIPDKIATTNKVPRWNPGFRRMDRNYYDLIRQR